MFGYGVVIAVVGPVVCAGGVGGSSILCRSCGMWIHGQSGGVGRVCVGQTSRPT